MKTVYMNRFCMALGALLMILLLLPYISTIFINNTNNIQKLEVDKSAELVERFSGLENHFQNLSVTAKISRRRHHTGKPEFEVEGRVEFIRQGPLLPYDTQHLLQQWLLINLRCSYTMVRPGRSQLYLLTGSVLLDRTLALNHLFPWHKKDANLAVGTRKWKHHRC